MTVIDRARHCEVGRKRNHSPPTVGDGSRLGAPCCSRNDTLCLFHFVSLGFVVESRVLDQLRVRTERPPHDLRICTCLIRWFWPDRTWTQKAKLMVCAILEKGFFMFFQFLLSD